jgi:hypothetical protein
MKGQEGRKPHSPISMLTVQTKICESSAPMSHRRCKAAGHGPAGVRRRRRKLLLTHPLVLRRGRHPTPIRKRIFLQNPCFSPFWSRGSPGVFLSPFCSMESMRCGDGEDGVLGEALLIMISLLHLGKFPLFCEDYCGDMKKKIQSRRLECLLNTYGGVLLNLSV